MNVLDKAKSYLKGLFYTERCKRNIERINEQVRGNYQSQQHFITDSPWDSQAAMNVVAHKANKMLGSFADQALLIDESSTKKAGKHSVGVSRQHNGNLGKVENSQTGVYASLGNGDKVCLVNCKLFLAKEWIDDKRRCEKAGIPTKEIVFKTKPQLALEIIKELDSEGIQYGWIGADALYGASTELKDQLDNLGKKYVLDIHNDQHIFLELPQIYIPENKTIKGRKYSKYRFVQKSVEVRKYKEALDAKDYKLVNIRKGTKGWITTKLHLRKIWTWNKTDAEAVEKTLIISVRSPDNIKYSISSFKMHEKTLKEFAFMQAQRHWIERAFQDEKSDLGLVDYQIRQYNAWYHHQALVMMAMCYVLQLKLKYKNELPLLSTSDVRLQIISVLKNKGVDLGIEIEQMQYRHKQRKMDILKHYAENHYFT